MVRKIVVNFEPSFLQQSGPIIQVIIEHPKLEQEEAKAVGLEFPRVRAVNGLIDTGSYFTIVNPALAETYKLRYTAPALVRTAGHMGWYREYAAAISFPDQHLQGFDIFRVVACPLASAEMSCLIGRDVLRHWELTYNGNSGQVSIEDLRKSKN